ncbi:hypothetical protein ABS768_04540 [Flavobacterium sp. ST-75]|uniref:Uncharacterized protein n=1 Tax=Flavobacterium rhizophilum TaxID=3163296 RepID=A0ABW8Y9C7_9FLAO
MDVLFNRKDETPQKVVIDYSEGITVIRGMKEEYRMSPILKEMDRLTKE